MSGFFSGAIDALWPHVILLTVAAVASFAVAAGIVLENPKWSLANVLVVGGVAIEAICTFLLFGFDEGISNAQQSKIIALEQQIAPRKLDGPLFAKMLRNAPKSDVQLLYVREDPDSYQLALQIYWYFGNSGWNCSIEKPIPTPAADSMYGDAAIAMSVGGHATGVTIVAPNIKDIAWESPFGALFKAFRAALGQAGRGIDHTMPEGALRIVVAPKRLAPGTLPPDVPDMSDRIIER
jgi:hypothetical protein